MQSPKSPWYRFLKSVNKNLLILMLNLASTNLTTLSS